MKSVIVMGKGRLAIQVADWFLHSDEYDLRYVVPVIPEPSWTDSLATWGRLRHLPIVESGHYKDIPGVADSGWQVDLIFSVFYDKILKGWFIRKATRALNLHNGPLPRYRGVCPINWALKNGERLHGATIHEITEGIDDGPIVAQVSYSIYPEFDEVIDVYDKALRYAWLLFQQTMPVLERIRARPQNHSAATYYSRSDTPRLGERLGFRREYSLAATTGSGVASADTVHSPARREREDAA